MAEIHINVGIAALARGFLTLETFAQGIQSLARSPEPKEVSIQDLWVGKGLMSAGQLETIVARVQVSPPSTGSLDVTALKLNYTDLIKNTAITASSSLAAMVTEKREEMFANSDKKVILMGARAQSAMNVQKAAEAMKQGDFGGAQGLLQKNEAIYDEAEEFTGAGSATVDRDQNAQYLDTVTTAPSAAPEEQNYRAKAMRVDAFKQAGRGASIY